jgi:hypothetical protein
MRRAYKTLTDYEYKVLSKVARKTGSDCWFVIKQDCHGTDYIYDWEQSKRMCLKTGVRILADSIDCQENFDNCWLEWTERVTLHNLFGKLGIDLGPQVDWRLPEFVGMSLEDFKKLRKEYKGEKYQKHGDDYYVDGNIYQFGMDDKCFGVVPCD